MTSKTESSPPKTTERAWRQVEAQLEAFYDAWQVRNTSDLRRLFSDDERLLLWGTDRWERIKGRAEADQEFGRWIDTCPP